MTTLQKTPTTLQLKFTPYAWAKLVSMRDFGETEISALGLLSATDALLVEDLVLPRQSCTSVSAKIDGEDLASVLIEHADQGIEPARLCRVWIHTHPGNCAQPSGTDEDMFRRVVGSGDWGVMLILARGGEVYARAHFSVGPGVSLEVGWTIDWNVPLAAGDRAAWEREYKARVSQVQFKATPIGIYNGLRLVHFPPSDVPRLPTDLVDHDEGTAGGVARLSSGDTELLAGELELYKQGSLNVWDIIGVIEDLCGVEIKLPGCAAELEPDFGQTGECFGE